MSKNRKLNSCGKSSKPKSWNLQEKIEMIKMHDEGGSFAQISKIKNINESSVRKIVKDKDKLKEYGMTTNSFDAKKIVRQRSHLIVNSERLLSLWIEDCNQKRIPLSQLEIQAKAIMSFFYT